MNPFDYVKSIRQSKIKITPVEFEDKEYAAFIINRALSFDMKSIMQANEMNRYYSLDKDMQYEFLFGTIGKLQYTQWQKKVVNEELKAIQEYYSLTKQKAMEVLRLLTKEQIASIMDKLANKSVGKVK